MRALKALLEIRLWSYATRRIGMEQDGKKKLVDSMFSLGVLESC